MALRRSTDAQSPNGAPEGAHFSWLFRADFVQPTAMLEGIKGLSRHKRFPPTRGGKASSFVGEARISAARGARPFIPRSP